jgi:hypothetical protein
VERGKEKGGKRGSLKEETCERPCSKGRGKGREKGVRYRDEGESQESTRVQEKEGSTLCKRTR